MLGTYLMTDGSQAPEALDAGFRLGELRVEPRRSRVIDEDGEERRLEPRAMAALVHLAAAGDVVRRDELIEAVWQTTVSDEVVSRAISLIRQALGDSARAPRFVETIPKVGYRLLVSPEAGGPPEVGGSADADSVAAAPEPSPPSARAEPAEPIEPELPPLPEDATRPPSAAPPTDPGNAHWSLAWVLIAGAMLWLLWLWIDGDLTEQLASDSGAPSTIAVLPLEDQLLSDDAHPIGLGLADTLRNELGRASALRVLARSSSIAIAREAADARELGERFGIDAVLEGSVLQDDERIAIQLSLSDARDGLQRWARTFEGAPEDLFELGRDVVAAVSLELTGQALVAPEERPDADAREAARPTSRAYAIYLQGLHYLALRGADGLERADELFSSALSEDPSFDAARVERARTLALLPYWSARPEAETFPAALSLLDEVKTDDRRVQGVAAGVRALIAFRRWQWEEAAGLFEAAVGDAPADAGIRAWYAQYLASVGDLDGSLREAREAWDLDPGSPIVGSRLAAVWLWLGRPDRAEDFYDQTDPLRLAARDPSYLIWLLEKGRLTDLEALIAQMHAIAGLETDWVPDAIRLVSGTADRARAAEHFSAAVQAGQVLPRMVFPVWILAGESDRALETLEANAGQRQLFELEFLFAAQAERFRESPAFDRALALVGHPLAGK